MSEPSTSQTGANKRLHMNLPQEHTNHLAITNNTMLNIGDLITQIVNFELNPLKEGIVNLRSQISHKIKSVEDYQIEIKISSTTHLMRSSNLLGNTKVKKMNM